MIITFIILSTLCILFFAIVWGSHTIFDVVIKMFLICMTLFGLILLYNLVPHEVILTNGTRLI